MGAPQHPLVDPEQPDRKRSVRSMLRDAALLGLLTFLFVYAYFVYLTHVGFARRIARDIPAEATDAFLFAQLLVVLIVCLICSAVGLIFSRRYGLGGFGDLASLKRALPWIAGMAAVGIPVVLFGFDRPFRTVAPGYYPAQWNWALAMAFSATFSSEVIWRFGMMTIFTGIVRNVHWANLMQAFLLTLFAARSFHFADIELGLNYFTLIGLSFSMVGSLAAGWLYYRFGILAALVAHLLFELRCLAFVSFS